MFRQLFNFSGSGKKSGLGNPSPELIAPFGGSPSAAGVTVTPETALRCPTVYASVKVLAESVAQLPLHLYRRTADGGKERASDHPLAEILHDQANDWTSAAEFRQFMQTQVLLHGNAFAFINRAGGRITELIPLPSSAVEVLTDAVTMEPSYRVTASDGTQRDYARTEILHLRTLGTSPNVGLSPIMQAREAIGLASAMELHAAKLFAQGARPSGVFKYSKVLGPETLRKLRDSFNAAHAGGENSGRTLILEDGMDFVPVSFSSVDLQFLELRRHQVAEIARVFRIPLHLLQELERTTHSNAEHMGQQFLTLTLLPWLKLWEGAIRRALLTPEERAVYHAEFLADDIARADLAARFEAYAKAVTNGLLSPNEIRAAENRAPYAGGDQFRLPLNTEDAGGAHGAA
ncbi:HK97 family phage portal protein [Cereibacter azotoformans]|uniref:HK97 family phage portal protein n=1 Tax=Cereibacter azotoformans TaxID=43057 RepID=A0A2T5JXR8_9RHOB|nr:HK97 family phage portal protein [Cereibacter azotoformans]